MKSVLSKTCHILIVEDNIWIGLMVTDLLEAEGYSVIYVNTAGKAINTLQHEETDLIILDIGLPDKNGNEFLEELGQLDRKLLDIPVVVISANLSQLKPSPQVKAALDKPFDLEKLLTIVEQNV